MSNTVIPNFELVDLHSHFLPCIDDGAKTVEESLAMLDMMTKQGVKKVVATPHFYADSDTPDNFVKRRANSCKQLAPFMKKEFPDVYLGAEVAYFAGMSRCEDLKLLNIVGTELILIEMPFEHWSDVTIDELISIKSRRGLTPIVAHIERYPDFGRETCEMLKANGVLIQSNAELFLDFFKRRQGLRLLESGFIDLLGSDSHRINKRIPNLGDATEYICEKVGAERVRALYDFASALLK